MRLLKPDRAVFIGIVLAMILHAVDTPRRLEAQSEKPQTTDATRFSLKAEDEISISPALQFELRQAATADDLAEAKHRQTQAAKLAAIYKAYADSGVKPAEYDMVREPDGAFHFKRRKKADDKPPAAKP